MNTTKRFFTSNDLAVCVLIVVLIGCGGQVQNKSFDLQDGGFLSDKPCAPPCFLNITPGITTEDEARETLRSIGLLEMCKTFNNESESGGRGIICTPDLVISFQEGADVVESVGFKPVSSIAMKDVITKYGDPSAVLVTLKSLPEEDQRTVMMLYYDELKVTLVLTEQKSGIYDVSADLQVVNIGYFDELSYKMTRGYSSDWVGYGSYELNNP